MLAPRADTILVPGDRLVLVAGGEGIEILSTHLDSW